MSGVDVGDAENSMEYFEWKVSDTPGSGFGNMSFFIWVLWGPYSFGCGYDQA